MASQLELEYVKWAKQCALNNPAYFFSNKGESARRWLYNHKEYTDILYTAYSNLSEKLKKAVPERMKDDKLRTGEMVKHVNDGMNEAGKAVAIGLAAISAPILAALIGTLGITTKAAGALLKTLGKETVKMIVSELAGKSAEEVARKLGVPDDSNWLKVIHAVAGCAGYGMAGGVFRAASGAKSLFKELGTDVITNGAVRKQAVTTLAKETGIDTVKLSALMAGGTALAKANDVAQEAIYSNLDPDSWQVKYLKPFTQTVGDLTAFSFGYNRAGVVGKTLNGGYGTALEKGNKVLDALGKDMLDVDNSLYYSYAREQNRYFDAIKDNKDLIKKAEKLIKELEGKSSLTQSEASALKDAKQLVLNAGLYNTAAEAAAKASGLVHNAEVLLLLIKESAANEYNLVAKQLGLKTVKGESVNLKNIDTLINEVEKTGNTLAALALKGYKTLLIAQLGVIDAAASQADIASKSVKDLTNIDYTELSKYGINNINFGLGTKNIGSEVGHTILNSAGANFINDLRSAGNSAFNAVKMTPGLIVTDYLGEKSGLYEKYPFLQNLAFVFNGVVTHLMSTKLQRNQNGTFSLNSGQALQPVEAAKNFMKKHKVVSLEKALEIMRNNPDAKIVGGNQLIDSVTGDVVKILTSKPSFSGIAKNFWNVVTGNYNPKFQERGYYWNKGDNYQYANGSFNPELNLGQPEFHPGIDMPHHLTSYFVVGGNSMPIDAIGDRRFGRRGAVGITLTHDNVADFNAAVANTYGSDAQINTGKTFGVSGDVVLATPTAKTRPLLDKNNQLQFDQNGNIIMQTIERAPALNTLGHQEKLLSVTTADGQTHQLPYTHYYDTSGQGSANKAAAGKSGIKGTAMNMLSLASQGGNNQLIWDGITAHANSGVPTPSGLGERVILWNGDHYYNGAAPETSLNLTPNTNYWNMVEKQVANTQKKQANAKHKAKVKEGVKKATGNDFVTITKLQIKLPILQNVVVPFLQRVQKLTTYLNGVWLKIKK